jgi:GTP:adenosylcobinamide-phosphate guanylyltransferase
MMHNLIILAGDKKGCLYEETGYLHKALIPIDGKAMLEWVLEAFHESRVIDNIVVVGPQKLNTLASMQFIKKRLSPGVHAFQNILKGAAFIRKHIYHNCHQHDGFLISCCDAALLNPQMIQTALNNIENSHADIVLHYVEKTSFEIAGLKSERTFYPINGKYYTGSTIYYLREIDCIMKFLPIFLEIWKNRKNPQGVLKALSCENLNLDEIQKTIYAKFSVNLKICISEYPELAIDVDKPSDLSFAQAYLQARR